jgi:hypothetical protein
LPKLHNTSPLQWKWHIKLGLLLSFSKKCIEQIIVQYIGQNSPNLVTLGRRLYMYVCLCVAIPPELNTLLHLFVHWDAQTFQNQNLFYATDDGSIHGANPTTSELTTM